MSEPNKAIAAIKTACTYCWAQITNLAQSIKNDWAAVEPVFKRCWAKKTIDSEQWSDLAQEEELRWQSARLIFKTFLLVLILGVIALLPKRLVTTVIPTKTSVSAEPRQQSYAEYTPPKEYEIDNGGRKKIIEVDAGERPPAGAYPYPNFSEIYGGRAPEQNREVNNEQQKEMFEAKESEQPTTIYAPLPYANLPATPGINAPLPVQNVPRSGVPLMPLGDRH